jgi:hypothetical protein
MIIFVRDLFKGIFTVALVPALCIGIRMGRGCCGVYVVLYLVCLVISWEPD